MKTSIKLLGSAALKQMLKQTEDELPKALEAGLTTGALLIQNSAKKKVVKRTGTLSRSIHTKTVEYTKKKVSVAVGTDVEYARRIEYGFSGKDSLGRNYNQSPRPYLRPALDEQKDEAAKVAAKTVQQILRKKTR